MAEKDTDKTQTQIYVAVRLCCRDGCTQRGTSTESRLQSAAGLTLRRRSFKLWYNYTLKASLRRYSSLAISSATQPGISGMATWMMYLRRIAKCCKPSRPQRDRLNTQLHQVTSTRKKQQTNRKRSCRFDDHKLEKTSWTNLHLQSQHWAYLQ